MSLQYFLSIDALATGIIALFFGLIVLAKNKNNIINQTLFLLTLATAFWAICYWQWLSVTNDRELALFWIRILSIGSSLIPIFYFHWISCLLNKEKENKKFIIFYYILTIFVLFFSFSSLFIGEVRPIGNFSFWPKAGPVYTFYLFFVYIELVLYSLYILLQGFKNATGQRREQIKYVLWGMILGFGGGATNFFLWYDINILPVGNVLVVLYPVLFSYSIIKHRFLDIRFVLRKLSVYFISIISLALPAFVIKIFFYTLFPGISQWADLVILIIALSAFPPLKDYYYRLANKYFFSSLYDGQQIIASLSDKFRSILNPEKIYETISSVFIRDVRVKSVAVFTCRDSNKYTIQYNKGFDFGVKKERIVGKSAYQLFAKKDRPVIIEELKDSEFGDDIVFLKNIKAGLAIPLSIKGKEVGLILLGAKESGDMYNDEDLRVLEVIGAQTAIALENALLYEEQKTFNIKLKKEIDKATTDLRQANEQLKKLDEAKSEFISIASHQLRTPLTAIRGYISMVLDGDFGKLSKKVSDPIEKVLKSSERLIALIENLLNISRIESGRMKYEYKVMQFETMVSSVVDELSQVAKTKKLELIYNKPKKPLPEINIDEEKIRQVVMNLIDNAVKYTPAGKVVVDLTEKDGNIEFCVSDSGMGISAEDLPNLFQKFSRGSGTFLIHTEGTGLGLYVARQMIETHSGKIWAESEGVGKGSRFCFSLPIKKA